MAISLPAGYMSRSQVMKEIDRVIAMMPPEVVRVVYSIGEDWSGDPGIFFNVVLKDEAAQRGIIGKVSEHVRNVVDAQLNPYQEWGLIPYFSFRSQSGNAKINDPEWA